ncbi:MAG: hypothetical protein K2G03_04190, partial [Bacilli bacterium]|nr:hypothetical protein [Bacilli bacterium]
MAMLALIFLIPIFCIGLVMYIMTLYNYAILNALDVPLLTIGFLITIVLSFFIVKLFYKILPKTAKYLNKEQNSNTVYNIFTFVIMFLFGLSIFIKSLNAKFNIFDCVIGIIMVSLSSYVISTYFLSYGSEVLKLTDIENIDDKINCLKFEHEKYGIIEYYTNDSNFKVDSMYKVK